MKSTCAIVLVLCLLAASAAMAADGKVGVDIYAQEGLDFILMENRHALADDAVRRMRPDDKAPVQIPGDRIRKRRKARRNLHQLSKSHGRSPPALS